MNSPDETTEDRLYLKRSLEIAIRLALVGMIVVSCFRIFSPFLTTVVWGLVIAIALFPVFDKVRDRLGGRSRLTATLFIALSLTLLLLPTFFLTESVIDEAGTVMHGLEEGTLEVPPPSEKVQTWPLIGEDVYRAWQGAARDMGENLKKFTPQLKEVGSWLASLMATVGGAVLQSFFAFIIAGILMMNSRGTSQAAQNIGFRLAGKEGVALVEISVSTIRSVVRGVLLVAIIQGLLAGIGFMAVKVPAAGLWALLVMIMAVIQLPPILLIGPIIIWVFSVSDNTTAAVLFMVYGLVVSVADGFLKPLLLGRGVKIPMLVILIGAIGGMLKSGVLGLFIGPVILAIGYQILTAWLDSDKDNDQSLKISDTDQV